MKPFLLFVCHSYYPEGGWDDFQGDFNTHLEAIEALKEISGDFAQIVSLSQGRVIMDFYTKRGNMREWFFDKEKSLKRLDKSN